MERKSWNYHIRNPTKKWSDGFVEVECRGEEEGEGSKNLSYFQKLFLFIDDNI